MKSFEDSAIGRIRGVEVGRLNDLTDRRKMLSHRYFAVRRGNGTGAAFSKSRPIHSTLTDALNGQRRKISPS